MLEETNVMGRKIWGFLYVTLLCCLCDCYLESYVGSSIAAGRASHGGQVEG